jgi:molybdate transport system permease protein
MSNQFPNRLMPNPLSPLPGAGARDPRIQAGVRVSPLSPTAPKSPRRRLASCLLTAAAFPLLALLVVPLVVLLLKITPTLLMRALGDSATVQAIGLSLGTSTATLLLVVALGTPLAQLLARHRFRGRSIVDALIDLPTVLPPAVAGVALLLVFGRRGIAGQWLEHLGLQIAFSPVAVVLAQTFVAAPYYIKSATVGLAAVSDDLLEAAALDGASPWQSFFRVSLPLAWRGVISGAALCWSRALGEFGATIIFAGNYPGRTQTMPLAVYIGFEIDLGQALTLAAVLLTVSFALLLLIRATTRR